MPNRLLPIDMVPQDKLNFIRDLLKDSFKNSLVTVRAQRDPIDFSTNVHSRITFALDVMMKVDDDGLHRNNFWEVELAVDAVDKLKEHLKKMGE